MNARGTMAVDPIVVEIVKGALKSCGDEMQALMVRTAMSPFIREKGDHFQGLADRKARLIYTTHDRTGPGMIETVYERYPPDQMHPGDVYWVSDPYILKGAISHSNDMCFIAPAFFSDEIVGYSLCFGHFWDVGGARPGSISPQATDIFQEGITVPPVRIVDQGRINDELYRTILRNSRYPDMLEGDTRAMMATSRLGQMRLIELFERYGAAQVDAAFEALHDRSERAVRASIAKHCRPGRYRFADYIDNDCVTDRAYRVDVELDVAPEGIAVVDCTGSDDQARGPINYLMHPDCCRMICSRFLISLDGTVHQNAGAYRTIGEVRLRSGSVLQPVRPAPLGLRAHAVWRFANAVLGVFAQATGGNTPAGSPDYVIVIFHALDAKPGEHFFCTDGIGAGQGARPYADGLDVIYVGTQKNYPIEFLEGAYPIRIERYDIAPDSGGPGRFRGGVGTVRDYRVLAEKVMVATRMANQKAPAWGVSGGRVGRPGYIICNPGQADERTVPGFAEGVVLERGDLLRFVTSGGGGYGDPFEREPERVLDDVMDGFVTVEAAREDYGVVIDESGHRIDVATTHRLRAVRRRSGELFDRGQTFEQLERARQPVAADTAR
jgi:N-methylhydantoinase B